MTPSFSGDRYKCLRCYDFDLCARCYAEERDENHSVENRFPRDSGFVHQSSHPMQCMMTQEDFELTYEGDSSHSWDRSRVVVFTCPVCGINGLLRETLVNHIIDEHSNQRSGSHRLPEMACPICISTDFYRVGFGDYVPSQLTDIIAHMQEHQAQNNQSINAPSSNNDAFITRSGTLSEFLHDRDLRRVILQNVPYFGNDPDFFESAILNELRRNGLSHNTNQRGEIAFQRFRQRLITANDNEAVIARSSANARRNSSNNEEVRNNSILRYSNGTDVPRMAIFPSTTNDGLHQMTNSFGHGIGSRNNTSRPVCIRGRIVRGRGGLMPTSGRGRAVGQDRSAPFVSRIAEANRIMVEPQSVQISPNSQIDIRRILQRETASSTLRSNQVIRTAVSGGIVSTSQRSPTRLSVRSTMRNDRSLDSLSSEKCEPCGTSTSQENFESESSKNTNSPGIDKSVDSNDIEDNSYCLGNLPLFYLNTTINMPPLVIKSHFNPARTEKIQQEVKAAHSAEKMLVPHSEDNDPADGLVMRIGRSSKDPHIQRRDEHIQIGSHQRNWRFDHLLESDLLIYYSQNNQGLLQNSELAANGDEVSNSLTRGHVKRPRVAETRMRKTNKSRSKERDSNIDNSMEFFQNNFKTSNISTMIDGTIKLLNSGTSQISVSLNEENQKAFNDWLENEKVLDKKLTVLNIDSHRDQINDLMKSIPEFANDDIRDIMSVNMINDENLNTQPMFEASEGTDEEMLAKKCESFCLKQPTNQYFTLGIFGSEFKMHDDDEKSYWKDYRFVHNRRSVFFLNKSSERSSDATVDSRFCKQLLLGFSDAPISIYPYSFYNPEAYKRLLRSILRKLLTSNIFDRKSIKKKFDASSVDEKNVEVDGTCGMESLCRPEMSDIGNGKEESVLGSYQSNQVGTTIRKVSLLDIPPFLWHFLDLSAFLANYKE